MQNEKLRTQPQRAIIYFSSQLALLLAIVQASQRFSDDLRVRAACINQPEILGTNAPTFARVATLRALGAICSGGLKYIAPY